MPVGKAIAAAPKLSDDRPLELEDLPPSPPETQPATDIMHLARLGDFQAIQSLYELGQFDASYCDDEGITPLHVCLP